MEDKAKVTQAQAIRDINENWPAQLEWYALSAKMHRAKYAALMREGFNPAQALELCKL